MIRLQIGTTTERKSVIVEPTKTLADILEENQVSTIGAVLHLNGDLLNATEVTKTLSELGVPDGGEAMLIAVVKADSAQ